MHLYGNYCVLCVIISQHSERCLPTHIALKPLTVFTQQRLLLCVPTRRRAGEINKKLGDKFAITETELLGTIEACAKLLAEGQELDISEGAETAADRILAEDEAEDRRQAQVPTSVGGGVLGACRVWTGWNVQCGCLVKVHIHLPS